MQNISQLQGEKKVSSRMVCDSVALCTHHARKQHLHTWAFMVVFRELYKADSFCDTFYLQLHKTSLSLFLVSAVFLIDRHWLSGKRCARGREGGRTKKKINNIGRTRTGLKENSKGERQTQSQRKILLTKTYAKGQLALSHCLCTY